MSYKKINKCRICGSSLLTKVISFPPQYLSATFVDDNNKHPNSQIKVPLTVVLCDKKYDNNSWSIQVQTRAG